MNPDQLLKMFKNRQPSIIGEETFRKYGVLVPLLHINGDIHILFEVRAKHMRNQPGDICFPGGKMDDSDRTAEECALRETKEELGLEQSTIQNVFPLDYVVSESGRIIYPFAGQLQSLEFMQINKAEVAEIFTVPLDYFLENEPKRYKIHLKVQPEEDFPYDLIYNGEDYNWNMRGITELFYQYEERVIWGLTAKILTHFITLLKSEYIEKR